jgi:hypothetical protein
VDYAASLDVSGAELVVQARERGAEMIIAGPAFTSGRYGMACARIAAIGILAEMAGRDGTGPPLVVPPTKATAMVSTGNYDERMTLPATDRALGRDRIALLDQASTDEIELPVAAIYCAQSTLGWGRLTCAEAEIAP